MPGPIIAMKMFAEPLYVALSSGKNARSLRVPLTSTRKSGRPDVDCSEVIEYFQSKSGSPLLRQPPRQDVRTPGCNCLIYAKPRGSSGDKPSMVGCPINGLPRIDPAAK